MNRLTYTLIFVTACFIIYGQRAVQIKFSSPGITVSEKTIFYKLAQNIIPIKIQQYGDRTDLVFIKLHDDEFTSVEATKRILESEGGLLIEIENKSQRNIRFKFGNSFYSVDPNRIFSKEGIKKSMDELGKTNIYALNEVEKFGQRIIQLIPETANCVIALHNNTPDQFSVIEYSVGNKRSADTKKIYINNEQDPDDFFLTTDQQLYEKLADLGYNSVLQDNKNCLEDGSLSVYCGKNRIRYVNCETEHGKIEQYFLMIQSILNSL